MKSEIDSLDVVENVVIDKLLEKGSQIIFENYLNSKIRPYSIKHSFDSGVIPCDVSSEI